MTRRNTHPALAAIAAGESRQERLARRAVDGMGSTRFLIAQTTIVGVWIVLNLSAVALRWDPYPFILLNLVFSTQAAYAAPLILLAARQADAKRDALANHDDGMLADLTALVACLHRAPGGPCSCAP